MRPMRQWVLREVRAVLRHGDERIRCGPLILTAPADSALRPGLFDRFASDPSQA